MSARTRNLIAIGLADLAALALIAWAVVEIVTSPAVGVALHTVAIVVRNFSPVLVVLAVAALVGRRGAR